MGWPLAKRNVYTNTHNCSVRSHGELTILRRGAFVRCCDFSETGARCSSGKQGGGNGVGAGGGRAGWGLNRPSGFTFGCHVWNLNTQTATVLVIRPWWICFTAAPSGTIKFDSFFTCLNWKGLLVAWRILSGLWEVKWFAEGAAEKLFIKLWNRWKQDKSLQPC